MKASKIILFLANIIFLIMSVIWELRDPSMEAKIAIGTFAVTLLLLFLNSNNVEKDSKEKGMSQKAGKNSKQYQAGRDMKIEK